MSVSTSATAGSIWRSVRAPALIGLLFLALAIITTALSGSGQPARYLDPDDASLGGARALAQLLRARGVEVDRVDSVAEAETFGAKGDRLLLVTSTMMYGTADAERLAKIPGPRLILGDVGDLSTLAPGVSAKRDTAPLTTRAAECDLPAARLAGTAFTGGVVFNAPKQAVRCYSTVEGPTLVTYQAGASTITVVGTGAFMTNLRLAEDGNAALAINLASTASAVTWLVDPPPPIVADGDGDLDGDRDGDGDRDLAGPEGQSLSDLMPDSIGPGVLMAVIAVVVTAFWRGRRLGPVVVERLPVVVRAAETVEGRGRLYRARRARGRAADALRAGAIDRIVPRLGLASGAGQASIVSAIAVRTGHAADQIGEALYGGPPADDAGLVALAGYLDFLERTVVTQ